MSIDRDQETDRDADIDHDAGIDREAGIDRDVSPETAIDRDLDRDRAHDPLPQFTGAFPVLAEESLDDSEVREINRRFAQVRRTVASLEKSLLQGPRRYTRRDLTEKYGIPERLVQIYWRSLGFTPVDEDTVVFTDDDAYAIGDLAALVDEGVISESAFVSITRGLGYHLGRLAMWITEAIVEDVKEIDDLSDPEAREAMLEKIPAALGPLESQVMFAFRRQLAAYTSRAASEAMQSGTDERFPLQRAVGFADLVQFTRLSQSLCGQELADVVERFEAISRDVITVGGGRVVKTVGDAIMFLADTPYDGAQIALSLSETITADRELPQVRVSLCWGSMFSRFGDVFGPTVNLAARLQKVGSPSTVVVDSATIAALEQTTAGSFVTTRRHEIVLAGIGNVPVFELARGSAPPLNLSW